jgi:hypothetical protein
MGMFFRQRIFENLGRAFFYVICVRDNMGVRNRAPARVRMRVRDKADLEESEAGRALARPASKP